MPTTPTPSAKETKKVHLVISGNFYQFKNFLRQNGIPPDRARYIRSRFDVYGFTKNHVEIHRVGTYWENPNLNEIEEAIYIMHL